MLVNQLRSVASFVRWRLKPVRWSGKLLGQLQQLPQRPHAQSERKANGFRAYAELSGNGYTKFATGLSLPQIDVARFAGRASGKAFVDVGQDFPDQLAEAFVKIMSFPGVQETVLDYFDGCPRLWNVALNYSDVSDQASESQLWHFDYGDTKQLHFMVYFTNVELDCGPFTFFDATTSAQVTRHPLVIERLTDNDLSRNYGINVSQRSIRLVGARGDVFAADPGRILHQGARCSKPRLVMFITFTTPAPMSRGGRTTMSNAQRVSLWNALADSGAAVLDKRVFV
jgi:hypothetical protein